MGIAGVEMVGYKVAGVYITGVSHWPWNTPGAMLGLFIGFEAIGLRYVQLKHKHTD